MEDGANGVVAGASGPAAAAVAAAGATPILNRIRAAAEISRGRKRKKKNRKRVKLNDDKFMNTHEGAVYRAVMEAGVRLHAEREKSTGAIADDDEAFKLRESRRLEKDKSEIPRVVVGGGLGTSIYSQGWESLAGMEEHVKTLKEMTLLPLTYPEMFESLGAGAARGVLLHGPPGTGKTLCCSILINQTDATVIYVTRNAVTERGQIDDLYKLARFLAPTLVVFEDIDTLGGIDREESDHPLLGEFLNCLAGVEENDVRPGSALAEGRLVVLLDILMPGMDGFAVLERMEFLPATAMSGLTVFMLSATLDREDLERAEGHPIVEALLPKPLDVHQLRGWTDQIPVRGT